MRRALLIVMLLSLWLTSTVTAQLEIDFGQTVEGLLSTGETAVEYLFSGERGQVVSITLIADARSSIDAYLQLLDANGNVLMEDDDSAGSLNSRIGPYRLPANGDYVIVATSLNRSDVGVFSLTLDTVTVRQLDYGQRMSGELTTTEPELEVIFTAEAGDAVIIDLTSDDFDAYLRLFSASPRSELTSDDDSGGNLNSRIGPYILTEAGDYHIGVSSIFGGETGAFELTLNQVNLLPITFGEPQTAPVSGNSPVIFSFEGSADQIVDVVVDSGNTRDTRLRLLGPNSYALAENDDTSRGIDPAIRSILLNEFGTHFIILQPVGSRDTSTPVTITLSETELPALDDGPQVLNLSNLETAGLLTFMGQAGETVTLRITLAAEVHLSPDITVRQGGDQIAAITSFTINDELSFGFDVPADGPVVIALRDYDYVDADITIGLERNQPSK